MGLLYRDLICPMGLPSTVRTTVLLSCDFLCSTVLPSRDQLVLLSVFTSLLSTHSCGLGMNVFSCLSQPKSVSGISYGVTWISALDLCKEFPCNGLVKWSDKNFPVRKYLTSRSPIAIMSLISKDVAHMFFFWLPLHNLPLFSSSMSLKLYWYMTTSSTSNPCDSIKYLGYSNSGRTLSAPIIFAFVEILGFIICLLYMLATNIRPRDIASLVWIQQSGCITYDASTHHLTMLIVSTININGMWMVDLIYCSTHYSFRQ